MASWDEFQPTTVPTGQYVAEIMSDPEERASQFKAGSTYKTVSLALRDQNGVHYGMEWAYSPKMPVYKSLLLILGGREMPSGHVSVPLPMKGKKFFATIIERPAKNDKAKLVNEITRVTFYDEPPKARQRRVSTEEPEDSEEPLVEECEDAPF